MSIESTFTVTRSDAYDMLRRKNIEYFSCDCNARLAELLYSVKESETENYQVVNDDHVFGYERRKYTW